MRFIPENKTILVGLIIVNGLLTLYFSLFLFYYYLGSICVHLGQFGELIWCTTPAGTFFPFPKESGHLMALSISHSIIDYLIYLIMVQTYLMYILPVVFSIGTIIFSKKLYNLSHNENNFLKQ